MTTPGPVLPFGTHINNSPSGTRVLMYPFGGGSAYIARPGTTERDELAKDIELAILVAFAGA